MERRRKIDEEDPGISVGAIQMSKNVVQHKRNRIIDAPISPVCKLIGVQQSPAPDQ